MIYGWPLLFQDLGCMEIDFFCLRPEGMGPIFDGPLGRAATSSAAPGSASGGAAGAASPEDHFGSVPPPPGSLNADEPKEGIPS
jgi:hypothetical protein